MEKKYPQEHRAERGGFFRGGTRFCRPAFQDRGEPGDRNKNRGFRPVADTGQ